MSFRNLGILCAVAMSFALGACSSKYRTDNHEVIQTVAPGSSFYIMLPEDGTFGHINYANSGQMLATEVYKQLAPYSGEIVKATSVETRDEAFAAAQDQDLEFLIAPQILHWEDRATEWSSRPDRITILYQAFNVTDKTMLANSTISASSKWATFGGDHPVHLLPVPTKQFVSSLLGKSLDMQN
ncbi:MAG: DUF4823 domain-containing protein [Thalassospira sp.]|uniref:DUF4823 domain-containing protein n=1 Tax=Thalassospira sp. TaxID=1912094 RepID=UPI0032ECACE3